MEKVYLIAIIAWVTFMSLYVLYHILLMIEDHEERKTEQRRAAGREKAYREIQERRLISDNRQKLWNNIKK